ncbi:hypothetical protein [Alienimonas chondri]|uniref:Nudix hydrolase domain-containing protein n=1 Tax=Alienimonas chondri TaxID=2681879 RepID=A0ABX1V952_9PLAN|nr:hypothetical protein [Alienimonas chondri]NNJ24627.1 hypothetical protein [Alienimonas chondri]
MPHYVGAIALVRRNAASPGDPEVADPAGRSEWLSVWNPARKALFLPEAEKLEGESYRDALVREVGWAAGLDAGKDFLLSHAPRAHIQFAEQCEGPTEGDITILEFYVCELFRKGRAKLDGNSEVRWLTAGHLEAGEANGKPIAARQLDLMKRADLIPPREG